MGKGPPFGLELVLANFGFPRLPEGIPKAFKWQKFASKRLPPGFGPKAPFPRDPRRQFLTAGFQATKVSKSGSKRLLARIWAPRRLPEAPRRLPEGSQRLPEAPRRLSKGSRPGFGPKRPFPKDPRRGV